MSRIAHVQICLQRIHGQMLKCEARLGMTLIRLGIRRSHKPAHQMCIPHMPDLKPRRPRNKRPPRAETNSPKKMTKYYYEWSGRDARLPRPKAYVKTSTETRSLKIWRQRQVLIPAQHVRTCVYICVIPLTRHLVSTSSMEFLAQSVGKTLECRCLGRARRTRAAG